MKHFLLALSLAGLASAEAADNPSRLGDRKSFDAEGVSLQPPEGCVTLASDGPDGQRIVTASRVVQVDGRDAPMGIQIEVIGDLDLATYRRMLEGLQGARGLPLATVDEAMRGGRPAWRANLPGREGEPVTRVLAVDAGDRLVVVSWAPREGVAREFGALLDDAIASVNIEARDPAPVSGEPAEDWAPGGKGLALKLPAGWKTTDKGEARALRNPRDRFENLAAGLMDGTVAQKAEEWERLKREPQGARMCVEAKRETYLGRASFVCRSRVDHQGIPVLSETRLVEHRGRLVFVSMTAREEKFDERRRILDAVLGTLRLEE